ncbi:MAG TPA: hypothetical protein VHD61_16180 [Lacunisphaera sp.]|nr:hypothetical protein [Lacunisphaera sp.]
MRPTGRRGFALVITLMLVALLVLCVLGLGTLVRVDGQIASAAGYQVAARQNARLGLALALGALQEAAGDDARITGMAGVAGIQPGAASSTRYWCGVWRRDGSFVTWLASGAADSGDAGPDPIELVSSESVGAASSTSANVEKEHVKAGRIPIMASETLAHPGAATAIGRYAWLVLDEGSKIGAYAPAADLAVANLPPVISPGLPSNQLRLRAALASYAGRLPRVLSYEQLSLLPTPPASGQLTPSVLQDCFHYVALAPRTVGAGGYVAGTININSASTQLWRCLLDTYNQAPGAIPIPAVEVAAKGRQLAENFAATNAGKAPGGPFTSIDGFRAYLATLFPANGKPTAREIVETLGPMLTVRSDTFRVRACGEAVNLADASTVEATAFCEAMVQRTPDPAPNGLGRRVVITTFRWLGPDDL